MSNIAYLGNNVASFHSSPEFDGYTRVTIVVSEDTEYSAGVETGRTLTLECPWGTQQIADNLLASIRGFRYQPYTATEAILDPAAELGDGVTVHDIYSGIYTMTTRFGSICRSDLSAPAEEVLNHEYQYISKTDRAIKRNKAQLTAELKVQADRISVEVSNRESAVKELYTALSVQTDRITAEVNERQDAVSQLKSQLSIQSREISAKVSKVGGDASSSFGWTLDDSSWIIKGNGRDILKASENGLEVYGKITAVSGQIGGFVITSNALCYNNHTWGGTNSTGIYIGPRGIQLGKNFKVDASGNLNAVSGTFSGNVKAGSIQYGGNNGYLSGSGIDSNSISGNRLKLNTVTTAYTSGGINTSLGFADFSNGVFNGYSEASFLTCLRMQCSGAISAARMSLRGRDVSMESVSIPTTDGGTKTLRFLQWNY